LEGIRARRHVDAARRQPPATLACDVPIAIVGDITFGRCF
jgi:hypothetical protein